MIAPDKAPLNEHSRGLVAGSARLVPQLLSRHRVSEPLREELLSAGLEALVLAGLRYDPTLGPFEAFARVTIRGALLRARSKEARALRSLERGHLKRGDIQEPTPEGVSSEDLGTWQTGDERTDFVLGLERVAAGLLGNASVQASNGEQMVRFRALCLEVGAALEHINPVEREVFLGHLEGNTLEELRVAAGVSKRTVQRMIERAQSAIRAGVNRTGGRTAPTLRPIAVAVTAASIQTTIQAHKVSQ